MFRAFTLFKIRDIPVRVDPTWLIAFALFTYLIYTSYRNLYPDWTLGLQLGLAMLSVLLLFTLVLIHEFAHSIVAQIRGYKVHSITLFMLGGVSNIHSEATKARDEFIIAVVGPLTNVIFFFVFWLILAVVPINNEPLFVFLNYARGANLVLAIFNMLPGIPLDGGRVLKSLIWGVSRNQYLASNLSAIVGQVMGGLMMAFGLLVLFSPLFIGLLDRIGMNVVTEFLRAILNGVGIFGTAGIWLGLIGFFMFSQASAYRRIIKRIKAEQDRLKDERNDLYRHYRGD